MPTQPRFQWPNGKQAALSLSFDDARISQVDVGIPLLDEYGVTATFYVSIPALAASLDDWQKAVASGHEIGNHTFSHPCTGNFDWSRENALEDFTLEIMRAELTRANRRITELLGVTPNTFAYPCGQTFVGRGIDTESYVPLVAELFATGRNWNAEGPNDPGFCDMAQLLGVPMDNVDFGQIDLFLTQTVEMGGWLILVGHEINRDGAQTTRTAVLEQLLRYVQDSAHAIWVAPVGIIGGYIDSTER